MSGLRAFVSRVCAIFIGRRGEQRLDEEIQLHLDLLADEYVARGMAPDEARRTARRAFGRVDGTREACYEERGLPSLDTFVQDVRFAGRLLRRNPGFTLAGVAILGLGIGVNNMFFTIVHAHTMRGLPIPRADRVVSITLLDDRTPSRGLAQADFDAIRERARSLADVAAFTTQPMIIAEDGLAPERVGGAFVSAEMFTLVGAKPLMGRDFSASDDRPTAPAVALLSETLWRSRYDADRHTMGRTILINGAHADIIGVMPDRSGVPATADVWLPLARHAAGAGAASDARTLQMLARLHDGVSVAEAEAEIHAIAGALSHEQPETHANLRAQAIPVKERYLGQLTHPAWVAFMIVGCLVVFISCANLAILMLGRSVQRSREIAIRSSMGASRVRLIRQLIVEGAVLAGVGAVAGLAVSVVAVRIFASAIPEHVLPYWLEYSLDGRVLAALVLVSAATVFLFALAPAMQASRVDLVRVLRTSGQIAGDRSSRRWTTVMLAAEIAVAVLLLAHVSLAFRTRVAPPPAERALATGDLLTGVITLPPGQYRTPPDQHQLYQGLTARLARVPGLSSSFTSRLPFTGGEARRVHIDGDASSGDDAPDARVIAIAPRYFSTLGVPLPRGREFDDRDGQPGHAHAIVNEAFVRRYLADRDPLGQRVVIAAEAESGEADALLVVGVAPDIRQSPGGERDPLVYVPFLATPAATAVLVVRSGMDTSARVPLRRAELQKLDPHLPLDRVQPMAQVIRDAQWNGRVAARLILFVTFLAVALATAGLFTAAAHSFAQRTPEMGLRMALGARKRHIAQMILGRAALQLGAGFAAGIACTKLWAWMLPSDSAVARITDVDSLLIVGTVLAVSGLAACAVPVRRATRMDPLVALRQE